MIGGVSGRIAGQRALRLARDRAGGALSGEAFTPQGDGRRELRAGIGWHLVQIMVGRGAHVQALLKRHDVATYMPMERRKVMVPRKRMSRAQRRTAGVLPVYRDVFAPMFPGYMMVHFDPCDAGWRELFRLAGVRGIMCAGGLPYASPDGLIERLVGLEVDGAIPGDTPVKTLGLAVGENVRICDGPLTGFSGAVEQLDESGRVGLLLSLFGRETRAELYIEQIEKL